MESATPFVAASLALAAGMLIHLHRKSGLFARHGREFREVDGRFSRVSRSLESSGQELQRLRGRLTGKADALYTETKLNEAIAELARTRERRKTPNSLARG